MFLTSIRVCSFLFPQLLTPMGEWACTGLRLVARGSSSDPRPEPQSPDAAGARPSAVSVSHHTITHRPRTPAAGALLPNDSSAFWSRCIR
ncbi:hypothetical protein B0T26DRAFT_422372 [Lasiosphaeria miniovina]|uniref:Uncharacterized protein n=1 Tax=Lasiosphaeria miniovina TaxID=1954250 RepID=A0AA40DQI5_9PEZI|nr:uncharacterized protein B0T26DRAFT_422372 [Lasiosphaeria miniovina]KAK0709761.1 hypothetical protein B0T26DRAFT_422372 [Lasiosphaeria miniovina]